MLGFPFLLASVGIRFHVGWGVLAASRLLRFDLGKS
jgi:hypothetical protein